MDVERGADPGVDLVIAVWLFPTAAQIEPLVEPGFYVVVFLLETVGRYLANDGVR